MTVTYCDITKKPIERATSNYTWETKNNRYDTILNKDLSVAGYEKLHNEIYSEMEKKTDYNFMAYKAVAQEKLKKLGK